MTELIVKPPAPSIAITLFVALPNPIFNAWEDPLVIVWVVPLLFLMMVLATELMVMPFKVNVPATVVELLLMVLAVVAEEPKWKAPIGLFVPVILFMLIPIVGWVLLFMKASADPPAGAPLGLQFVAVNHAPLVAPVQVDWEIATWLNPTKNKEKATSSFVPGTFVNFLFIN